MNSYADYADDYLPGDYYRQVYGSSYSPQQLTQLKAAKRFKFIPKESEDGGELFQRFLALQNNPEALAFSAMNLPETPMGSFGAFLGA